MDSIVENNGVNQVASRIPRDAAPQERAAAFASCLRERIDALALRNRVSLANARVIVSGMASSAAGWRELAYAAVPFPLDGEQAVVASIPASELALPAAEIWLVSGVRTQSDILRGEECELMGLFAPELPDALELPDPCRVILPGVFSRHALIRDGSLVDFSTYLTGELCEILSRHGLLRSSVVWPPPPGRLEGEARDHFERGLRLVQARGLSHALFRAGVRPLLEDIPPALNAWFLSGVAISSELLPRIREDPELPIVLASGQAMSEPYALALRMLGAGDRLTVIEPSQVNEAVPRGHARLLRRLAREG